MAGKANTGIDVSGMIDELEIIAQQVEAANAGNADLRAAVRNMTNKVDGLVLFLAKDETKSLFTPEGSEDEWQAPESVLEALDTLSAWVTDLAPTQSGQEWDRNIVTAKMQGLVAFATAGLLTDDQVNQVNALGETFAANNLRTNGGVRNARTPQPEISGRPAQIRATAPNGDVIGTRKGNVKNSGSNVKTMVKEWAESQGVSVSDEDAKQLLKLANDACENGTEQTWQGVTIAPVSE